MKDIFIDCTKIKVRKRDLKKGRQRLRQTLSQDIHIFNCLPIATQSAFVTYNICREYGSVDRFAEFIGYKIAQLKITLEELERQEK